jgi:hypothetical protein
MITSIDDFKNFLISLVRGIVSAGDAKLAAYKVQIDTFNYRQSANTDRRIV